MPRFREEAEVLSVEEAAAGVFLLSLRSGRITRSCGAGQFVMVRPIEGWGRCLMRPISVCDADRGRGTLKLLVRVAGKGTGRIARLTAGEAALVMGPLGSGFRVRGGERNAGSCVVVAGGIGVAPMPLLVRALRARGRRVHFVYGARTREGLCMDGEIEKRGCAVTIATDDGTAGLRGTACDAMRRLLDRVGGKPEIFACGPMPMLKAVAEEAGSRGLRCQVSVEQRMACGVGACLGCAVRTSDGSCAMVCRDGPVFEAERIFGLSGQRSGTGRVRNHAGV